MPAGHVGFRRLGCALVSIMVAFGGIPVAAFADTVPSSIVTVADGSLPAVVAGASEPSTEWGGLKGRTSAVRVVPFARGAAKGRNLIVIQVEALQASLIGRRANGHYVTPNLNSLVSQSTYFPYACSQISGGNTSDAEWVVNTSLYPPINQSATTRWGNRVAPSLPRLLRKHGYKTATFHANAANFWNRRNLYATLGFSRYYDRSFFGTSPMWHWGTSDDVMFSKTLSVLKAYRATGRPFYAQLITLSSHGPFDYPATSLRPWKASGVYANTPTGRYLSSESYADAAIGRFVSNLKKSGLWNDSVVVIYGDHFGQRRADTSAERAAQKALYGRNMRATDRLFVPLIIHMPGQTAGTRITSTVGQIDVLPTLADALGVGTTGMRLYGRDAFTDSRAVVGIRAVLSSGTYVDSKVVASPEAFARGTVTLRDTGLARRVNSYDRRVRADVTAMMAASVRYTDRLPKRPGVRAVASDAIIPTGR